MFIQDQFPFNEKLSEAEWYTVMAELEKNWLLRIADAQFEYQEERMRLKSEIPPKLQTSDKFKMKGRCIGFERADLPQIPASAISGLWFNHNPN